MVAAASFPLAATVCWTVVVVAVDVRYVVAAFELGRLTPSTGTARAPTPMTTRPTAAMP